MNYKIGLALQRDREIKRVRVLERERKYLKEKLAWQEGREGFKRERERVCVCVCGVVDWGKGSDNWGKIIWKLRDLCCWFQKFV
jgi:hypothetical protein